MTATASTLKQSFEREKFSRYKSEEIQVIARELKKIERTHGAVVVRQVLELSRSKSHPLHRFVFALSDREAAENHRLDVVRGMCRAVRVVWRDEEGTEKASMPMLVSVQVKAPEESDAEEEAELVQRAFRSSEAVMADPVSRKALLDEALRQADYWQEKYRRLNELTPVFVAIAKAKARVRK